MLIRVGRYQLTVNRCPSQRRFATAQNGEKGRLFWTPGIAISVCWGDF